MVGQAGVEFKEWWDVRGVNPIQYKTTHPRYYKEKNMLRGSFLR
jgi:hypothetical protein